MSKIDIQVWKRLIDLANETAKRMYKHDIDETERLLLLNGIAKEHPEGNDLLESQYIVRRRNV